MKIPVRRKSEEKIYYTYTINVDKNYRAKFKSFLQKNNIETKIYYDKLIPDVAPYKASDFKKDINNATKISKEIISLPMHENLSLEQIYYTCGIIKKIF